MTNVRVRFAPSPTGGLHIGGVRTALFNYLFARKNSGKFILRIEDTDQSRFVEGAEAYILNALKWLGIVPDESPENEGDYGPYRQSERKEIYLKYAQELIQKGLAYYAFDSSEELDQMRERLKSAGMANLHYNASSRMTMKNSLTLGEDEVQRRLQNGEPYVVRIKVPSKEEIRFKDQVRGFVVVHSSTMDDKVILKSDGLPTYHLANVVDDYLMKITHVIRGEEWLPSAPLHVLLYKYLGWENDRPEFAHLPLILKPDGNGKLSKRAADKAGFPIFPLDWTDPESGIKSLGFKTLGFIPEALLNFLALLGWNPGSDKEIFNLKELSEAFSIEKVGKSGTKFDFDKAKWFNQQYLNAADDAQLGKILCESFKDLYKIECSIEKASKIAGLFKTRVTFQSELLEESLIIFEPPKSYDQKVVAKKYSSEAHEALLAFSNNLRSDIISGAEIKNTYSNTISEMGLNPGKFMQLLRVALTGKGGGPDLEVIMELLGPSEVKDRIKKALDTFSKMN